MFEGEAWYEYLEDPMKALVDEAYYLLDREEMSGDGLADYAFVVFPMAKAYEGFLKKYFLETKLISQRAFESRHFRIGRSLNPALPKKFRDERWIYDDLEKRCSHAQKHRGENLAVLLWKGWKLGRNKIFHYFAGEERMLSLEEARERVDMLRVGMTEALECVRVEG